MRAWQKTGLVALFLLMVGYVGATAWMVSADWRILSYPQHYEFRWELWPKIGGGILLAAGFALTAWRIGVASRQAEAALEQAKTAARQVAAIEDGQVTERFTRAVEQLGSDKAEVRLGGIFSLRRIAWDSPRDRWAIIDILAAYVRQRARVSCPSKTIEESGHHVEHGGQVPRADVQAAMTVIASMKKDDLQEIDLRRTNLVGIELIDADLGGADLSGADLSDSRLRFVDLSGANLSGAHVRSADLEGGDLEGAILAGADLTGAILRDVDLGGAAFFLSERVESVPDSVRVEAEGYSLMASVNAEIINPYPDRVLPGDAILEGANLTRANLEGANLRGAYLKKAVLYGAHLENACLEGARFFEAKLMCANLAGANLFAAILDEAVLAGANLTKAGLFCARLQGAELAGVCFRRAQLCTADMSEARHLKKEQLSVAILNVRTILPDYLKQYKDELLEAQREREERAAGEDEA